MTALYIRMGMIPYVKVLLAAEKAAHGFGEFYNRFLNRRRLAFDDLRDLFFLYSPCHHDYNQCSFTFRIFLQT